MSYANNKKNEAMIHWPQPFQLSKRGSRFHAKLEAMSNQTGIDAWDGNLSISTLFYIYLLNKYKSHCLLYRGNGYTGFHFSFDIPNETYIDYHSGKIIEQLVKCIRNGVSIIIIPLIVSFKYENDGATTSHTNVLIYRKKWNTIEHFEPHGKMFRNNRELTSWIHEAIKYQMVQLNLALKQRYPVTLVPSENTCPQIKGFQKLEEEYTTSRRKPHEDGYCAAWGLFFMELALCNPGIPSKQLQERLYASFEDESTMGNYLLDMIRGYTRMINEKIVKFLDILFDTKFTVESIYNSPDIWKIFADEIALLAEVEMELINHPHLSKDVYIRGLYDELKKEGWEHMYDMDEINNKIESKWHNILTDEITSTIPVIAKKAKIAVYLANAMRSTPTSMPLSPSSLHFPTIKSETHMTPTNKKRKRTAKQSLTMTTRLMEEKNKRTTRSASKPLDKRKRTTTR